MFYSLAHSIFYIPSVSADSHNIIISYCLSLYEICKASECHGSLHSYTLRIWGSLRWGVAEIRKDLVLPLLEWRTVNTHEQVSFPLPSRPRNMPIPNLVGCVSMDGCLDGCLTSHPVRYTNHYIIRPFHSSKQQLSPPHPPAHPPPFSHSLSFSATRKNPKLGFPDVKILLSIDKGVVTLVQAWR